ncbi:MAG: DNA-directed RNA polymerase subunit delta [Bacilli bacterium]|nr:DNA-directed RNA polymerase subunit delta [Bacilli bacterium]
MKLKEIPIEELELLSYTDLTYMLLKEEKITMTTAALFKRICELLDYSDAAFESKIGDYYTSLTLDKRFVLLKNNEWDVRDNHSIEIIIDDEDEEEIEIEDELEEEIIEEIEDIDDVIDDDLDDEDIDDLSIVTEDELEEE